jgi:MoxR-like ATPase
MDWYSVDVKRKSVELPPAPVLLDVNPANYRPDPGLAAAVNVAILLGQPLLVTGEPGTGKTMLASSVAWQLGLSEPLTFETKSTSVARDLFYSYDAIGRFHAAQLNTTTEPRTFITYNAFGLAILRTNPIEAVAHLTGSQVGHRRPVRSIVLIDEIDKAPRDFPNDVLTELAGMQFRIPELGAVVTASPELRPIVIITSNSEKNLPDAFLRRCIYYNIPFPSEHQLIEIISLRLDGVLNATSDQWVRDALDFFLRLRREPQLLKKPSTAELLAWLITLRRLGAIRGSLRRRREEVIDTLGVLVKGAGDLQIARNVATSWLNEP